MKGIETGAVHASGTDGAVGSDHCPAMKGIETGAADDHGAVAPDEATTAPQ